MTADRDALLEEMLPTATGLAIAVHDRDQGEVADLLGPVLDSGDRDRIGALIIALAALVPGDMRIGDLLAWAHHPGADQLPFSGPAGEGEKQCRECELFLPLEAFHRDRSRADGRVYVCRACKNKTPTVLPTSYRRAREGGLPVGVAVHESNTTINAARMSERARKAA